MGKVEKNEMSIRCVYTIREVHALKQQVQDFKSIYEKARTAFAQN